MNVFNVACQAGQFEIAKLLLDKVDDVNFEKIIINDCNKELNTPFIFGIIILPVAKVFT